MEKHYDLNFLREYYGDNMEAMKPLLKLYCEETPKEIENIENSLESNDAAGAKAATHKVKTNVALMSIKDTTQFIEAMHQHGKDADVSMEVKKLFPPFKNAVLQAIAQLESDLLGS